MSRFLCLVVALCTSGWTQLASAQEFTTRVIAVLDGDTVLIRRGDGVQKIRLADIDAPEVAQPFGASAKRSLGEMVLGKQVRVVSQAVDQYGRMVAHLGLDGLDVNTEQIRRGMAWEYSHYHSNKTLSALEAEARQAPRGLWAQRNPTPPWDWRKLHPNVDRHPVAQPGRADTVVRSIQPADPACSPRKHCSAMHSCEEALHYLQQCGGGRIDGDGDGVPCEKLCKK